MLSGVNVAHGRVLWESKFIMGNVDNNCRISQQATATIQTLNVLQVGLPYLGNNCLGMYLGLETQNNRNRNRT